MIKGRYLKLFIIGAFLIAGLAITISCADKTPAQKTQFDPVWEKLMAHIAEVKASLDSITCPELAKMMEDGTDFILLDVRTKEEYDAGHIAGAVSAPRGRLEFMAAAGNLGATTDKYVLYCQRDARAALSTQAIKDLGFERVSFVIGGFKEWSEEGYPVYNQHGEWKLQEFGKKENSDEDE